MDDAKLAENADEARGGRGRRLRSAVLAGVGAIVAVMPPLEPDVAIATVVAALGQIDTTISTPCCGGCTCPAKHAPYYRHFGYKRAVLSQHLATIHLRCPDTNMCDTVAVGGTWSVWVDGFDAHGRQPYWLTSSSANFPTGTPVAIYTVRDTTIATAERVGIRATTVTARKAGSTWIVGTHGALLDSLKLVVQ